MMRTQSAPSRELAEPRLLDLDVSAQRSQRATALLAALGRVSARLQTTLDPNQILASLGAELSLLGFTCFVALLDAQGCDLVIEFDTVESTALTRAEKLAGLKMRGFRLTRERLPVFAELVDEGKAYFVADVFSPLQSLLPGVPRKVVEKIVRLINGTHDPRIILVPLAVHDHSLGAMCVWGEDLREADMPPLEIFATQVAAAIEVARLHEQQKRDSERRYRELFDNLPIGLYRSSPDGELLDANPALLATLGYPDKEAIADVRDLYVDRRDRTRWRAALERRGEVRGFEFQLRRADGTALWMKDSSQLVRDRENGAVYYEGALENITARKQSEQQQEEMLRELDRRASQLQALNETLLDISARRAAPEMLAAVAARATELLRADGGGVYLIADDGSRLERVAVYGAGSESLAPFVGFDQGLVGEVFSSGKPIAVREYEEAVAERNFYPGGTWGSVVNVPLVFAGRPIGVLGCHTRAGRMREFDAADIELLEAFARQAALAIENARLYSTAQRRLAERTLLLETGEILTSSLQMDQVWNAVAEQVSRVFQVDGFAVSLWRKDRDELETLFDISATDSGWWADRPGATYALADYPATRRVLLKNEPLQVLASDSEVDRAEKELLFSFKVKSMLMIPLVVRAEVIGILELFHLHDERVYSPSKVRLAQGLANQVAVAILNARLYESEAQRVRDMTRLNKITQAAASSLEFDEMLQTLSGALAELIGADNWFITLWDETRQMPIPAGGYEPGQYQYLTDVVQAGEVSMTASVLAAGRPLVAEDVHNSPYISPRIAARFSSRSLLCLPLIAGEQKLGAALVAFDSPHHFTADEIARCELAAGYVALALANAHLLVNLESARRAAESANRTKTRFLANMSHELRTPLNSILGFLQLLEHGLFDGPEERNSFIAAAMESSRHLLTLIDDIIDVARIEAGDIECFIEAVQLDEVLDDVLRLIQLQASAKHLAIKTDVAADMKVLADPSRLRQVLINLINNAIKFTPAGEIRVRVSHRPERQQVRFEIEDTGIGVPEAMREHVFEDFVQVDDTNSHAYEGSGLGLAICRTLIELMDGEIGLGANADGVGTCVWFTLPAAGA